MDGCTVKSSVQLATSNHGSVTVELHVTVGWTPAPDGVQPAELFIPESESIWQVTFGPFAGSEGTHVATGVNDGVPGRQVTVGPAAGFVSAQVDPTLTVLSLITGQVMVMPVVLLNATGVQIPTLGEDTVTVGHVTVGPAAGFDGVQEPTLFVTATPAPHVTVGPVAGSEATQTGFPTLTVAGVPAIHVTIGPAGGDDATQNAGILPTLTVLSLPTLQARTVKPAAFIGATVQVLMLLQP